MFIVSWDTRKQIAKGPIFSSRTRIKTRIRLLHQARLPIGGGGVRGRGGLIRMGEGGGNNFSRGKRPSYLFRLKLT